MNPPSALYGAMNKERKPFTYTPGGLDLSEIKSERMAKRLMRNAMSQGVPETPVQTVQSPPASGIPNAIPNFNCLPVQVFPTFQLPANPKSLLRTRSNPNTIKETCSHLAPPLSTLGIDDKLITDPWNNKTEKPLLSCDSKYGSCNNGNSNNISSSINFSNNHPLYGYSNYGSNENRNILLPEKSYDVEVCQTRPKGETNIIAKENNALKNILVYDSTIDEKNMNIFPKLDIDIKSIPVTLASSLQDTDATNNYEQKEVKVVQKQSKKENKTNENGDAEVDVVIKLPTKSSAAKTETKVEISKKILPDGTIEETKTTTTKTTIDGKTEITTKTETKTIPKEVDQEEIEEIEEEEDEENEDVVIEENISDNEEVDENESNRETNENGDVIEETSDVVENKDNKTDIKPNGHIITGEEKVESSTVKKVVVMQSTQDDSEEEIEEEEGEVELEDEGDVAVEEIVILKKPESKLSKAKAENAEVEDDKDIQENVKLSNEKNIENQQAEVEQDEEEKAKEEDEDEEDFEGSIKNQKEEETNFNEETKQKDIEEQNIVEEEPKEPVEENFDEDVQEEIEEEFEEAEDTEMKEEISEEVAKDELDTKTEEPINSEAKSEKQEVEYLDKHVEEKVVESEENENIDKKNDKEEIVHEIKVQSEPRVSFREPSIPLDKVEDVEIKPIGPAQEIIKKSHTEIITTTTDKPTGALSTQTEYNKIENIVTVNRTTKILDHAYEQTQPSVPTLKTYFSSNDDRVLSTPQPLSKPYQPIYPSEPQPERRHSLLLDRLSVDRQVNASDIYQNNYQYTNQTYEQNQWTEPQSEVLTVSNVKPSTISKDQQWYHQINRENTISSSVPSAPILPSQQLRQAYNQPQPQPQIQIQQPEPQYQNFTQPQYKPKPEFKPYVESNLQNEYRSSNDYQQNSYPNYTPSASWASNNFDSKPVSLAPSTQPNQYSSFKKESTDSYQKSTQFSSYVPPPWEQDASYVPEIQNYYQPSQSSIPVTPSINQAWKPKPASKYSKNTPTSYIPPAPNQSFVKPLTASDQSKLPGRKTYYSEYERRYISVPESTYIPGETKFQPQPDPSPQYYYDNNEPAEVVEPQWRKELREFTEKTSEISNQYEKSSVRPPWEDDPKYNAPTEYQATVTPTWTQTLRPRTWRERSYEPEYIGSKSQQTNTLGRGRPQSSYLKSNVDTIPERPRGVSVDRYNPNNYQPPLASEHPPVQSHTLNPNIQPKTYHNPNVPVYHSRASAEPREHVPAYPQSRPRVESKAPPVQSRSFKYLQWITGTED